MGRRIFQVHFCIRIHDSHSHHLIIHFFICINKQCMESQLLASPHTATAIPFPPRRNKPPSAAFALQAITASPPQKTRSPPTPHIPHFFQRAATTQRKIAPILKPHRHPPIRVQRQIRHLHAQLLRLQEFHLPLALQPNLHLRLRVKSRT